ncbi:hypothetical protein [Roseovarius confluentis]|uniref:hypothetical protein n=1 Tax=Roseovarius confluentis TaxID=1852027 RepID=UPI0011AFA02F|nr:hypothetical protein [Roseovarius confluentis]
MAKLKIRFVLNKGRRGAPLGKLGRISEQAEKFLRALSKDCGVDAKPGEWLAADFENHSVQFDAEFQGVVDAGLAQVFERSIEVLADFDPDRDGLNGMVRDSTALEYAKIGNLIDPDEEIGLGIIPHRGGSPKWRAITYSKAQSMRSRVEKPIPAIGGIQGVIHSWVKGVGHPYIQVRELSSNQLVKVLYGRSQHSLVADAMEEANTVVLVSGECTYDRVNRSIVSMSLERLKKTASLSPDDFDRIFGSFPEFQPEDDLDDAS